MSQALVKEILAQYGQPVTVHKAADGTKAETLAFLQPVTKQGESVPEHVTGLGWYDGRLWLYLGDMAVDTGDIVAWNDRHFRVRSAREWYLGREVHHWWAVLEQAKEAAQ